MRVTEDWNFYSCKVNGVLASIFVNLGLRQNTPDSARPVLLWVWIYMKSPRHDGLSSPSEFDAMSSIEDKLTNVLSKEMDAVLCGRITTDGRREFYYYSRRSDGLNALIGDVMSRFPRYEFDCGEKIDPEWSQYLKVLYPSDEDLQRMENRKVLHVLREKGDTLSAPRDVRHWVYFATLKAREEFRPLLSRLEYRIESEHQTAGGDFPFGVCVVRFQSVKPSDIDEAVIELFHLAKEHGGEYDGWETQILSS